ncbi:tRNA pseudouridine(38-40) synthase TruA [uncultured Clostridium sp.]|uniref:tRNA pseudouridine(38-40) synthase TruA n=1 Tax=uncultured Clostridium sp. TaxID=59620 RepID=UPI002635395E|nr:tRNA pseudouridine(38-40) synthase TruA [uncultured Clostridium sp.]
MRNIKLVIQYDGTRYKGWQKQNVKGHEAVTIQDKFEKVLSKMMSEEIQIIGCGRTDAGVHANNYIANFKCKGKASVEEIQNYLKMYLPEDIVVKEVKECSDRFHSRFNVVKKTYVYTIDNNTYCDVFNRRFAYHVEEKINIKKMEEASKVLIGTHDFQSFTNLKPKNGKTTIRTIESINIKEENKIIKITYSGNGFLLNMVRILTGTLIEAGQSKITAADVEKSLNAKSRSEGGFKVPSKGLCMEKVEY